MDANPSRIDRRYALLTACIAVAIVYGSLFPFHYRPNESPIEMLLATARTPLGGSETVANILFYVPLGLAAAAALGRSPAWARVVLAGLCGTMLSTAMELSQAYVAYRMPDLWDIYANAAGAFLGAGALTISRSKSAAPIFGLAKQRPFVWLMLTLWLGYQLFPFWFSAGARGLETTIATMLALGHLSPVNLFEDGVVWLAVALLLEALVGAARSRLVLACLTASVLVLRAMLPEAVLPAEQVWSGALAVLVWSALLWRWPQRGAVVAALFAIYVALAALAPYHFLTTPRHFGLVPFVSFLGGSRQNGARTFLDKAFTYGTLVWLLVRAGWKLGRAAAAAVAWVLVLRIAQIYLPDRSAEITDAMLTLAMAGVMKLLRENPSDGGLQASGDATKRYPIPRTVNK